MTSAKAETIALFRAALAVVNADRALVRRQAAMVPANDNEPDDEGDGEGAAS